jgi:hypothetical protein
LKSIGTRVEQERKKIGKKRESWSTITSDCKVHELWTL